MPRNNAVCAFDADERQEILDRYGRFVSKSQASEIISCSERTIGRQIEQKLLNLYTVGRSRTLRLKTVEVLALMERVA